MGRAPGLSRERRSGSLVDPTPLYSEGSIPDAPAMANPSPSNSALSPSGMGIATACYLSWGLVPVYWKAIDGITADEALIPRVLWTLTLLLVVSAATGALGQTFRGSLRDWGFTLLAALLLAGNWTLFIYAIYSDQVIATSLGYYINPLVSTALGLIVLGERLNRAQMIAVVIAAAGVATMTFQSGQLPWISLVLAMSFALYGLMHKLHPQPPLGGLTREMLVLSPIVVLGGVAILFTRQNAGLLEASFADHAYLSLTGVITAGPLLLFHAATKRLPLVAIGMFQFIAPTMTLGLATLVYGETFAPAHVMGFGLVWLGLGVFTFDSVHRATRG